MARFWFGRNRHRLPYTLLNIAGLVVGMAVCLVVGLYAYEELSADRFHERHDRIVQIGFELPDRRTLHGPYPLSRHLAEEVPGVEQAVATHLRTGMPMELADRAVVAEFDLLYTEAEFFHTLSFDAVLGDPAAALEAPDGLVLTESVALALFGLESPLGQTVRVGGVGREWWRTPDPVVELTVRAVVADPPSRSSVHFEAVAPVERVPNFFMLEEAWPVHAFQTFALLDRHASPATVEGALPALLARHVERPHDGRSFAIPLTSVYFSELYSPNGFRGQRRYLAGFSAAALFILLIGGLNYVNLATAQGLRRAREVGVRKAIGATRAQLARRFLGESLTLSMVSLVLGLGAAYLALPAFNDLVGTELSLVARPAVVLGVAAFVLTVGLAAGSYPALILSSFEPVNVLRDQLPRLHRVDTLRKGLVTVQFAASTLLLLAAAVIFAQLNYVQTADRGFDGQRVAAFELPAQRLAAAHLTVRNQLESIRGIEGVSLTSGTPGWHRQLSRAPRGTISAETHLDPDEILTLAGFGVDAEFPDVMGLRIVAGTGFQNLPEGDRAGAVLINETAARQMGWSPDDAVGRSFAGSLHALVGAASHSQIVGVVQDFNVTSVHEEVPPVVLQYVRGPAPSGAIQVAVRLTPGADRAVIGRLEQVLAPFHPDGRVEATFIGDRFHAMYESERRLARVVAIFTLLAMFVAALGLFGLTALAALQRRREVAIRKVLGATVVSVVVLLGKDFLKLVVIGFAVAAPLAYWLMSRWLEGFAYHVQLSPALFVGVLALLVAITVATVAYHAIRSALADTVRVIRAD